MAPALGALFIAACIALRNHVAWGFLIGWMCLFALECVVKMLVANRFLASTESNQRNGIWRRVIWAGSMYSGIVYGLCSMVLILPLPQETLSALFTVYGGIIILMCSISTLYLPSAWLITFPLFIPLPLALSLNGDFSAMALGALMIFVGYLTVLLTRSYSSTVNRLVNTTSENLALLEELETQMEVINRNHDLAQKAVVDKSRFVALASHDLRQPLHALGMFQSSLRRKCINADNQMLFDAADQSINPDWMRASSIPIANIWRWTVCC